MSSSVRYEMPWASRLVEQSTYHTALSLDTVFKLLFQRRVSSSHGHSFRMRLPLPDAAKEGITKFSFQACIYAHPQENTEKNKT